jgi:hypothetical protein
MRDEALTTLCRGAMRRAWSGAAGTYVPLSPAGSVGVFGPGWALHWGVYQDLKEADRS